MINSSLEDMSDLLEWAREKLGDDTLKIEDLKDHVKILKLLEIYGNKIGKPSNIKIKATGNIFQKRSEKTAVLNYANSLNIFVNVDISLFDNEKDVTFLLESIRKKIEPKQNKPKPNPKPKVVQLPMVRATNIKIEIKNKVEEQKKNIEAIQANLASSFSVENLSDDNRNAIEKRDKAKKEKEEFEIYAAKTLQEIDDLIEKLNQEVSLLNLRKDFIKDRDSIIEMFDKVISKFEKTVIRKIEVLNDIVRSEENLRSEVGERINKADNEISDLENIEIVHQNTNDLNDIINKIEELEARLTEMHTTKIQEYYTKSKEFIEIEKLPEIKTYSMELNETYYQLMRRASYLKALVEKTIDQNKIDDLEKDIQSSGIVARMETFRKSIETIRNDPRIDYNRTSFSTSRTEIESIINDVHNQEENMKSIRSYIENNVRETLCILNNSRISQNHSDYTIFSLQQQLRPNEQKLEECAAEVRKAEGHVNANEFLISNDPNNYQKMLDDKSIQVEEYISPEKSVAEVEEELRQTINSVVSISQSINNCINEIKKIGIDYRINIDKYCSPYINISVICQAKKSEIESAIPKVSELQQLVAQSAKNYEEICTLVEECTYIFNETVELTKAEVIKIEKLSSLLKEFKSQYLINRVDLEEKQRIKEVVHNARKIESRYCAISCNIKVSKLPEMVPINARIANEPAKKILIRSDFDVDKTCKLVRNELGVKNDLVAKINDIELDGVKPFVSSINKEDLITFVPKKQESIIHVPLVKQEKPKDNEWLIFSSTSRDMMTKGIIMNLMSDSSPEQIKNIIKSKLIELSPDIPHDSDLYVYLPTGIPFERGTLGQFIRSFPEAKHNIYVVVSNKIPDDVINEDIDEITDVSDSRTAQAYSPTSFSSVNGLSAVASFLGYIHCNGDLTNELLYGLSKRVPFVPLINGLILVSQNKELKFKDIVQITAPLHTLLVDAYRDVRKEDVFNMIPDFLPYLVCADMALPNMIYYNTSPNKIIRANTDELSHKIDDFVVEKKQFYAINLSDLGSIENVQFEYNPTPEVIRKCNEKITVFKPKSIMECNKSSRPAFIDAGGMIELCEGNITKFDHESDDKNNDKKHVACVSPTKGGLIQLINPQEGERKSKDYTPDGLVCVAVDLSGSMSYSDIPGLSNIESAKKCFKMFAQKAFDFNTLNWYGLVEFGRNASATKMIEIQKIPADFKDKLNEAHACGCTPMWSAISLSINMLLDVKRNKKVCKDAPMKIILLTDGDADDWCTDSITSRLKDNEIRIDAMCINGSIPQPLYSIAKFTGGYIFNPRTQEDLEDLAESEPLFDMSICKYAPFREKYLQLPCDDVDAEIFSTTTEIDYSNYVSPDRIEDYQSFDDYSVLDASIKEEIKKFGANSSIKPLINRNSITDWVILIQLSEYNNLWYAMRVIFTEDFPYKSPKVRFINPPYHANVTKYGRIYPEIKSYNNNPFNLIEFIKDVQKLLNTPYDRLHMTNLFDDFAPADTEHKRTFNDEANYRQAKERSFENGKSSPEEFC